MDIEYLKSLKQAKNLTVKDLSNLTNIPEGTINNLLSGKTENPSFEVVQKLAIALDADTNYIIFGRKNDSNDTDAELDALIASYHEHIRMLSKDKTYLAAISLFLTLFIVAVLIFDLVNGGIGYIRY